MNFAFAGLIFFWGAGSLFLVALKTKAVRSVFLKKPSILRGIIGSSYQEKGLEINFATLSTSVISFTLAVISALRNKLTHPLWIPYLLFYGFMAFIILSFLITLKFNLSWLLVLIGIIIHQALGILFPKKFPEIKNNNRSHHSGANEVSNRI